MVSVCACLGDMQSVQPRAALSHNQRPTLTHLKLKYKPKTDGIRGQQVQDLSSINAKKEKMIN